MNEDVLSILDYPLFIFIQTQKWILCKNFPFKGSWILNQQMGENELKIFSLITYQHLCKKIFVFLILQMFYQPKLKSVIGHAKDDLRLKLIELNCAFS